MKHSAAPVKREPSIADQRAYDALVQHRLAVIRYERGLTNRLEASWSKVRNDLVELIREHSKASLEPAEVQGLIAAVHARVELFVAGLLPDLQIELMQLHEDEADKTREILRMAVGALALRLLRNAPIKSVSTEGKHDAAEALRIDFDDLQEGLNRALAAPIVAQLRAARTEAVQRQIVIARDDAALGVGAGAVAGALKDGWPEVRAAFDRSAAALSTQVGDKVQQVLGRAAAQVFQANRELIKGDQYTAILDDKTCPICGKVHGVTYWLKKPEAGYDRLNRPYSEKPVVLQHSGCRCFFTPVFVKAEQVADDAPPLVSARLDRRPAEKISR